MTTSQKKPATPKKATTKPPSAANNDLKTEPPLSEKDEVKKAEQRTGKRVKK